MNKGLKYKKLDISTVSSGEGVCSTVTECAAQACRRTTPRCENTRTRYRYFITDTAPLVSFLNERHCFPCDQEGSMTIWREFVQTGCDQSGAWLMTSSAWRTRSA